VIRLDPQPGRGSASAEVSLVSSTAGRSAGDTAAFAASLEFLSTYACSDKEVGP